MEYIIENQEKFYRLAYSYVNNREDALDVVQNSICSALENYGKIRDIGSIKTWFYRVLVNESINFIKRQKREVAVDVQEQEPAYYEKAMNRKTDCMRKSISCRPMCRA